MTMRSKWTQLHPRQWPSIVRFIDENDNKRELTSSDLMECWIHRIGYYLVRKKREGKKQWFLVSPANGELLGDWTFNSNKKKPPFTQANSILRDRLFGMRMS